MGHGRKLTCEEEHIIGTWREYRVIVEIDKDKLRDRCQEGAILVFCGDGDQSWDFVNHLVSTLNCTRRIHFHAHNGGALRLHPKVNIPSEFRIDAALRAELKASSGFKDIDTLLLSGHFPCSLARLAGLDLPETLTAIVEVADIVAAEQAWPRKLIVPLFHLDRGDGIKRMYFIEAATRAGIYQHI